MRALMPFIRPRPECKAPQILDVGCGSGLLWAAEAAKELPTAQVLGVDLSPAYSPFFPPQISRDHPGNLKFEVFTS